MTQIFTQFQSLSAIAITEFTAKKLQTLCENIGANLWIPEKLNIENINTYSGSLKEHIIKIWHENKAIIFSLATGAVIRLIADLLQDKETDPAIIVIDSNSNYVISLCGGHQGGADILTQLIAHQLDAIPIITGASHNLNLSGIDVLGKPFGWRKGEGNWTRISASIARGETIKVVQDAGSTLWQNHLPPNHTFEFNSSQSDLENINSSDAMIFISDKKISEKNLNLVQWHPRVLWVGIGCERGTSFQLIKEAINQVFDKFNLSEKAIAGIATIDIKADEKGILQLCQEMQLPLVTFSALELNQIEVPNPSDIVKQEIGTPSVAEASAIKATYPDKLLIVEKQIIKQEGEKGAVTVAIAKSALEYTGRQGKIYLVGIGPGSLTQITPAAKTAITQADAIIGYKLYIDLILDLIRPSQIIETSPITQEKQRAERAIELAKWGLNVAVISSGDCGIYGMGGLVLETLSNQGWDGKTPTVEVLPGITAMQAAAAKLGAPLMHDFCAISLSDLLTPWEVIEKRLIAVASADFVTSIYNPKSQNRTQQIVKTQEIFLQYRNLNTPVAIVHSVDRQDEQIIITTLEKMLEFPIDMLTVIIIGNSKTKEYQNWLITPRGYYNEGKDVRYSATRN